MTDTELGDTAIKGEARIYIATGRPVLLLAPTLSEQLPSRGLVLANAICNRVQFLAILEPDGAGSHWTDLPETAGEVEIGDPLIIELTLIEDWPEPEIPGDFAAALEADCAARAVWEATTVLARWDWIRSIRSTNNPATRAKRITVACSKLASGKRRPCCFDRSRCTDPAVSRNGVLA